MPYLRICSSIAQTLAYYTSPEFMEARLMEVLSHSAAVHRKPNHPASLILSHINYSKITCPSTPQRVRDKGRGEANM